MSNITTYDKLIRDKIPEIIESHGKSCEIDVLNDGDNPSASSGTDLYEKLQEEVNEFLTDDNLEELADLTEVIHAILKLKGKTPEDLEDVRVKKLKDRGGFEKRLLLEKVVES
jgi:predicted house-cleaning noncanonical NTP pyrophosphatase (MazG superfamily)